MVAAYELPTLTLISGGQGPFKMVQEDVWHYPQK